MSLRLRDGHLKFSLGGAVFSFWLRQADLSKLKNYRKVMVSFALVQVSELVCTPSLHRRDS